MNQPTAIIVTEIIIRNGIGREVNPFGNNTPHWLNFESAVKSYPCPSIANTEPGKTVLAELINEFWDGKRWVECNREIPFDFYQGDTTRQIWVPIVEQKEGEAHNKELNRLIEMVKSGGYDNEAEIIAVLEKNKK
jgi:hypothetical protein